ncbi:unnamed protein product [Prorocentrum cordatum]|uniref:Secreted protein n=1 Tax=Prorocentrum cordatum TaxID=2364126 RepID=A0ABN9V3P3_9DINO|nr:unnamed protein product [Polarella glacialis]
MMVPPSLRLTGTLLVDIALGPRAEQQMRGPGTVTGWTGGRRVCVAISLLHHVLYRSTLPVLGPRHRLSDGGVPQRRGLNEPTVVIAAGTAHTSHYTPSAAAWLRSSKYVCFR